MLKFTDPTGTMPPSPVQHTHYTEETPEFRPNRQEETNWADLYGALGVIAFFTIFGGGLLVFFLFLDKRT